MTAVHWRELELGAQTIVRGEPPMPPNTVLDEALWLGPDERLVLGARESDCTDAPAAVDVSAARVCLELSGPGARAVLASGCSLDLRPRSFGPGRCAQTLLARAQVILWCTAADTYRILVRPSFAPYLRAWLDDAAVGLES